MPGHLFYLDGPESTVASGWRVQVFEVSRSLAEHLGKTAILSQDRPGFVVNRVLMPMINEAFYTLMEVTTMNFAAMGFVCRLAASSWSVKLCIDLETVEIAVKPTKPLQLC